MYKHNRIIGLYSLGRLMSHTKEKQKQHLQNDPGFILRTFPTNFDSSRNTEWAGFLWKYIIGIEKNTLTTKKLFWWFHKLYFSILTHTIIQYAVPALQYLQYSWYERLRLQVARIICEHSCVHITKWTISYQSYHLNSSD